MVFCEPSIRRLMFCAIFARLSKRMPTAPGETTRKAKSTEIRLVSMAGRSEVPAKLLGGGDPTVLEVNDALIPSSS